MEQIAERPTAEQLQKYEDLKTRLRQLGSVAVAFSGGVDSSFLICAAKEALGERAMAVTVRSCFVPEREIEEAEAFCAKYGIRQIVCDFEPLESGAIAGNPKNRCYLCKREIMGRILQLAQAEGAACVAEGSNLDDIGDYRPGLQALAELGIKSPLREGGFTKADIRALSRYLGLPTWDKQSMACLASRFVYGETITREKLAMVDRAEQLLLSLGFRQLRVRIHGMMARIEIPPEEFPRLLSQDVRKTVSAKLRALGFTYVTLDLQGYRTGSMNETL